MITWMEMLKYPKKLYVGRKLFPLDLVTFSEVVEEYTTVINIH